jgi:hypothetical protein
VTPEALPDPLAVALAFTAVLDRLGIPYVIGGSFASSVHGEPRSTNDIDVVADLRIDLIARFVAELGPDYYVSVEAAREAVRTEGTFNVIHMQGGIKIDVFVAGRDQFNQERLAHREAVQPVVDSERTLFVDVAEHSIVRKLEWFRRGGEVSERQWRDVLGMLRVQGERLDKNRLHQWATRLGVIDLLERARAAARLE